MYDSIVLPVDGSDEARHAARRGLEFARAFGATVHVLHVVERKTLRLTETAAEKSRLRERGEAAVAEIADMASDPGPVETELLEGKPAARIDEYADERGADLIVLGRQGRTGLGRRLLGGVTEGVLHRSDVPVFVVPGPDGDAGEPAGYARVLVPTDGSENAEAAAPHGAEVARQFGSTLHVLSVVDLQAAGGLFDAGGLDAAFVERLEADGQVAVDRAVSEVGKLAPDVAVRTAVERVAADADAAVGIREYVEDADIDLVVMGSHGRSNLGRQLLGSVASTVLRTVDVPVLIVKRTS
ncbi:universal stress protein [Natronomonas marina]|jgi:nucleotide-binding universal stress UspA family protein|uniref:universal stress protein n=1 Tax=Natronomonas marina TaxID=2961939 RepID=UPI0020C969EE|nr:universal stress protein [Natronomonas marina]